MQVEQVDRTAAAPYLQDAEWGDVEVMAGAADAHWLIYLLARHREAAHIEGIRLGLEAAAGVCDVREAMYRTKAERRDPFADDTLTMYENFTNDADATAYAATAIRAIDPAVIGAGQLPQRADSGR